MKSRKVRKSRKPRKAKEHKSKMKKPAKTAKKQVKIKQIKIIRDTLPIGAVILKPGNSTNTKTGTWRIIRPIRDGSKCIYCGICWQFCPDIAISKDIKTDYDYCKGCGICANVCPVKCIKMEKEEK